MSATSDTLRLNRSLLDVKPDTVDFRDLLFIPTLTEVPVRRPLEEYLAANVPVLDQGEEGACTGFGLATVVHYLISTRKIDPDSTPVSTRMLFEMARLYDEWEGTDYSWSSCRGAMKGWHKHGVCADSLWPYTAGAPGGHLSEKRAQDGAQRPLGAYFRVNHKDLVAMHCALTEAGVVYASARIHAGWFSDEFVDGEIPLSQEAEGGHAFAIIGYDQSGFWIQNSWGTSWGINGFARIGYDDWLQNGWDVWVARLGVPVRLGTAVGTVANLADSKIAAETCSGNNIRPHIISIGNDGQLRNSGTYGTDPAWVEEIFSSIIPQQTGAWRNKRLLLYAHGGLVSEGAAVALVAKHLATLLDAEVFPLSFIWKTDPLTTLFNHLEDELLRRSPEQPVGGIFDGFYDWFDDRIEPIARRIGKFGWDEMKENAHKATILNMGGARIVADQLRRLVGADGGFELHLAGHSAGSIFLAPLVRLLTEGCGLRVSSCTLWAPACTTALFHQMYAPAMHNGMLEKLALYTLTAKAERDDFCSVHKKFAKVYFKSLLYLVSNAFETERGTPILGMAKFIERDSALIDMIGNGRVEWIRAPEQEELSGANHHGDFDDDDATLLSTLERFAGTRAKLVNLPSRSAIESRRQDIRQIMK